MKSTALLANHRRFVLTYLLHNRSAGLLAQRWAIKVRCFCGWMISGIIRKDLKM
ncbi:unnamed protein product [Larinioides sclopetarius]|uniref:Uncharacterized protein n=1 Tax=Larinioides sclopetarius TaxID=280406 RepID=A0AAV1ZP27_9ARAC